MTSPLPQQDRLFQTGTRPITHLRNRSLFVVGSCPCLDPSGHLLRLATIKTQRVIVCCLTIDQPSFLIIVSRVASLSNKEINTKTMRVRVSRSAIHRGALDDSLPDAIRRRLDTHLKYLPETALNILHEFVQPVVKNSRVSTNYPSTVKMFYVRSSFQPRRRSFMSSAPIVPESTDPITTFKRHLHLLREELGKSGDSHSLGSAYELEQANQMQLLEGVMTTEFYDR